MSSSTIIKKLINTLLGNVIVFVKSQVCKVDVAKLIKNFIQHVKFLEKIVNFEEIFYS